MENVKLSRTVRILGTTMTVLSYIFLAYVVIAVFFVFLPEALDKISPTGDSLQGSGDVGGYLIGTLIAVIAMVFIVLQFATLHGKLKKFADGKQAIRKFKRSYIICWILLVLTILVFLFSRNILIILGVLLIMIVPLLYLFLTHKYTKKSYE